MARVRPQTISASGQRLIKDKAQLEGIYGHELKLKNNDL